MHRLYLSFDSKVLSKNDKYISQNSVQSSSTYKTKKPYITITVFGMYTIQCNKRCHVSWESEWNKEDTTGDIITCLCQNVIEDNNIFTFVKMVAKP